MKKKELKAILKDSFWYFCGTAFSRLGFLFVSIFIARMLGETGFGKYSILKSSLSAFTLFGIIGLALTATKFVSEFHNKDVGERNDLIKFINTSVLFSSSVVAFLMTLFADSIAITFFDDITLAIYLRVVAVGIILESISNITEGIILGIKEIRLTTISNVFGASVSIVATLILTFHLSIIGALAGYFFFSTSKILIYYGWLASQNIKLFTLKIAVLKKYFDLIKSFSLPAFMAALLTTPVTWYINTLIVRLPNGYSEMAFYNAGLQWSSAILMLTGAVSNVALPHLSSTENNDDYKSSLNSSLLVNLTIAIAVAVPLIAASKLIMSFYGESFTEHYMILIVRVSASVITSANSIFTKAFASKDMMWQNLGINTTISALLIIGSYLFVNKYGALGVSYVYLASYLIEIGIRKYYFKY